MTSKILWRNWEITRVNNASMVCRMAISYDSGRLHSFLVTNSQIANRSIYSNEITNFVAKLATLTFWLQTRYCLRRGFCSNFDDPVLPEIATQLKSARRILFDDLVTVQENAEAHHRFTICEFIGSMTEFILG